MAVELRAPKKKGKVLRTTNTLDTRVCHVVWVVSGEPIPVPLITALLEIRCAANEAPDLALALQELQCQTLACVPCDVAVHLNAC
jgi:hypothetical protein